MIQKYPAINPFSARARTFLLTTSCYILANVEKLQEGCLKVSYCVIHGCYEKSSMIHHEWMIALAEMTPNGSLE